MIKLKSIIQKRSPPKLYEGTLTKRHSSKEPTRSNTPKASYLKEDYTEQDYEYGAYELCVDGYD